MLHVLHNPDQDKTLTKDERMHEHVTLQKLKMYLNAKYSILYRNLFILNVSFQVTPT